MPQTEPSPSWRTRPYHQLWLSDQARSLLEFFQRGSINPRGGFFDLDDRGNAIPGSLRQIHNTARMVHCFAIGSLLGHPGSHEIVDHGMQFLWSGHRDAEHGGYFWSLDEHGPADDSKQAYGHAFVLLAASSARVVGHPLADRLLADITEVIDAKFWEHQHGAVAEEFARDWSPLTRYRGQNSNMHLTEALMAAFEATGDPSYRDKAERIAELIIGRHAARQGYRVAEHFDADWNLDRDYRGSDMFRPAGTTPGHWLEWSRLLLQLWVLGGKRLPWLHEAGRELFRTSIKLGWDQNHGGLFYTLDWDNKPALAQKLWWPCAEGIGAAAFLCDHDPSAFHETWYRRLWDFAANHFVDRQNGGWIPELSESLQPTNTLFTGKPDLYHAVQACLIPLFPANGSLTSQIPASPGYSPDQT
jgi:sulfoquinovose isomerase